MRALDLLDVLLPTRCAACGVPGGAVCGDCAATLVTVAAPLCAGCGAAVPVALVRCGECLDGPVGARQAVVFAGVAATLVTALKDRRRRDLAPALADLVVARIDPPAPGAVLVPVPGGPAGVRARGFDHAALIAEALGRRWGRPVARVLRRARGTPTQRGAHRAARVRQLRDAIDARPGMVPRFPVLVDDVRTTGATLAACAGALRAAGAVRVGAVCVARVPRAGADVRR